MRLLGFTGIPGSLSECHGGRAGEETFSHRNRSVIEKTYNATEPEAARRNSAALLSLMRTHLQLIWMRPPSNSDLLPQRWGSSSIVAPRWPMRATWYCVGLTSTWQTSNSGGLIHSRVCGELRDTVSEITTPDKLYLNTLTWYLEVSVSPSVFSCRRFVV